jgi:RNA polymerase sigma-70 factor, ECF subfamily
MDAAGSWTRGSRPRHGSGRSPGGSRSAAGDAPDVPSRLPIALDLPAPQDHLCDMPVAEVAAETGVAVGTAKARLSRGRTALAALLADDPTEEPRHA